MKFSQLTPNIPTALTMLRFSFAVNAPYVFLSAFPTELVDSSPRGRLLTAEDLDVEDGGVAVGARLGGIMLGCGLRRL